MGVFGLWLVGRKLSAGWAVGIGAQALWAVYALATRQYGFMLSVIAYSAINVKNWRAWRAQERSVEPWAASATES